MASVSSDGSGGTSLAYVDGDGQPLDVSRWVRANIMMVGLPAGIAFLGYVDTPDHRSVRAGLWLGAAFTLVCLAASRLWSLLVDRRHRDASREWWVVHQAAARRRGAIGGTLGFLGLACWVAVAIAARAWFVAVVLVGPIFGTLLGLAFVGDSWLRRRARATGSGRFPRN